MKVRFKRTLTGQIVLDATDIINVLNYYAAIDKNEGRFDASNRLAFIADKLDKTRERMAQT